MRRRYVVLSTDAVPLRESFLIVFDFSRSEASPSAASDPKRFTKRHHGQKNTQAVFGPRQHIERSSDLPYYLFHRVVENYIPSKCNARIFDDERADVNRRIASDPIKFARK
jgi:hypothetical protein